MDISCPFSGRCSDYQERCGTCRHNTIKRSYYEPEYWPYYPWRQWPWKWDWYVTGPYPYYEGTDSSTIITHYESYD